MLASDCVLRLLRLCRIGPRFFLLETWLPPKPGCRRSVATVGVRDISLRRRSSMPPATCRIRRLNNRPMCLCGDSESASPTGEIVLATTIRGTIPRPTGRYAPHEVRQSLSAPHVLHRSRLKIVDSWQCKRILWLRALHLDTHFLVHDRALRGGFCAGRPG